MEETLCASVDLNFGECNASGFSIEISDVEDISGLKIEVYVNISGYSEEVPIFTGYVDSAKIQPERSTRKIIAYDDLYVHGDDNVSEWYDNLFSETNKPEYKGDWNNARKYLKGDTVKYNGAFYQYLCEADSRFSLVTETDDDGNEIVETYTVSDYLTGKDPEAIQDDANISQYAQKLEIYNPVNYGSITVKEFRDSLFNYMGIPQESVALINDSVRITKTLETTEIKFSDCIKAVCQINAVFGHMSEKGIFKYISLGTETEDFSGNYKATDTTYEEFSTKKIDSVRLYGNTGAITNVYGSGPNCWNISNNFLLYSLQNEVLNEIAEKLFGAVNEITYTPTSLKALISVFPISLGSRIVFTTYTGEQVAFYALKHVLSGGQLTGQTLTADGNEARSSGTSIMDTLGMIESKTNAIVEQVYEKFSADSAEIKIIYGDLANYKTVVTEKIQAAEGEFESLSAKQANFEIATTEKISAQIAEINRVSGEFAAFKAGEFSDLKAKEAAFEEATVRDLQAIHASIRELDVTELTARVATIEETYIGKAEVGTMLTNYATIGQLNAANGQIEILSGKFSSYQTQMAQELIAAKGWMAEGAIGDAQISNVSANKLGAGTIDTAIVTVAGTDGRLRISDNTIQIKDANRVRVQIGKDVSGDYSMSVWDADGKLIWDALGATEDTIQRQIIRDKMVADDAGIQALKIDFQSFETALTQQGVTISGTVVQVGDKALNVALSEQTQAITEQGETLTDHATRITANENAIKLKVSTQDFDNYRTTVDGEIGSVKNRLSVAESSVTAMRGQIALKVEQVDIDTTIEDKLASYSTTTETQAAIDLSKSSILTSVSQIYSTKSEVSKVSGKVTSLETWKTEASQKITKDGIIQTVGNYYAYESDLTKAENRITTAESRITQQAEQISLRVEKAGVISAINQTAEAVKIDASKINLSGYVTMTNLATSGQTAINGGNITTGLISADRIDVSGLFAKDITATGTIRGVNLVGATGSFSGSVTATSGKIGDLEIEGGNIRGKNDNGGINIQPSNITLWHDWGHGTVYFLASGENLKMGYDEETQKIGDTRIDISLEGISVLSYSGKEESAYIYEVKAELNKDGSIVAQNITAYGKIEACAGIQLPNTGDSWVHGMTETRCLVGSPYTSSTGGTYHPILRQNTALGNVFNLGGITVSSTDDRFGVYIFRSGRTDNGYDCSTYWNAVSGTLNHDADIYAKGAINSASGFISTSANGYRIACGNYGFFIRNDGGATYFMFTNSGDPYGSWNDLRPITINNATGNVGMGHALTVGDYVSAQYANANAGYFIGGYGSTPYIYTESGDINFRYTYGNATQYTSIASIVTGLASKASSGHTHTRIINGSYDWVCSTSGNLIPRTNTTDTPHNVGNSNGYVANLYYQNQTKVSDRRRKIDQGDLTMEEANTILRGSKAKRFLYRATPEDGVQYGLYAQDFRDLLISSGIGYVSALRINKQDEEDTPVRDIHYPEDLVRYGLDYQQFTPILIKGWQGHDRRLEVCENRIFEISAKAAEREASAFSEIARLKAEMAAYKQQTEAKLLEMAARLQRLQASA